MLTLILLAPVYAGALDSTAADSTVASFRTAKQWCKPHRGIMHEGGTMARCPVDLDRRQPWPCTERSPPCRPSPSSALQSGAAATAAPRRRQPRRRSRSPSEGDCRLQPRRAPHRRQVCSAVEPQQHTVLGFIPPAPPTCVPMRSPFQADCCCSVIWPCCGPQQKEQNEVAGAAMRR